MVTHAMASENQTNHLQIDTLKGLTEHPLSPPYTRRSTSARSMDAHVVEIPQCGHASW